MVVARSDTDAVVLDKDRELEGTRATAETPKIAAGNEAERNRWLRPDITVSNANNRAINSALQEKIEQLSRDNVSVEKNAERDAQVKDQEMERMKTTIETSKKAAGNEVEKNRQLQSRIAALNAIVERERGLKEQAMRDKSGMEISLQEKIDQLTHDGVIARKNTEEISRRKSQEIESLAKTNERLQSDIVALDTSLEQERKLRDQASQEFHSASMAGDMSVYPGMSVAAGSASVVNGLGMKSVGGRVVGGMMNPFN